MHLPRDFVRRHARPFVGGAIAVGVLAIGGIAYAANGSSATGPAAPAAATAAAASSSTSTSHAARQVKRRVKVKRRVIRGTVTAIHGDTWTIQTRRGVTVTVDVTSSTKFGTKADPASASSFRVGSAVAVGGRRTGTRSITARHVWTPKTRTAAPAT